MKGFLARKSFDDRALVVVNCVSVAYIHQPSFLGNIEVA